MWSFWSTFTARIYWNLKHEEERTHPHPSLQRKKLNRDVIGLSHCGCPWRFWGGGGTIAMPTWVKLSRSRQIGSNLNQDRKGRSSKLGPQTKSLPSDCCEIQKAWNKDNSSRGSSWVRDIVLKLNIELQRILIICLIDCCIILPSNHCIWSVNCFDQIVTYLCLKLHDILAN